MCSSNFNYLQLIIIITLTIITNSFQPTCNKLDSKDIFNDLPINQYIYSAQLPINQQSNSYLTFLFYGQQLASTLDQLNTNPTIIWLNGGPGTTSHLGNYMEIGPIFINEKGKIFKNSHSWNLQYNLLFVDQPIGVGYSFANSFDEIPEDMEQLSSQFIYALNSFIQTCNLSNLAQQSEWYFAGESYAGKYIPAIVYDLLKQSTQLINLKGVILGNPWTEPQSIIRELAPYSFNMGLIDYQERQYLEKILLRVVTQIKKKEYTNAAENLQKYLLNLVQMSGNMNYYNIRKFGSYENHYKLIEQYLDSDAMKTTFHFPLNHTFVFSQSSPTNQGMVFKRLKNNICQSDVIEKLEYILSKLKVLIYNGQNDALCTNSGTQRWVNQLKHTNQEQFYQKDFEVIQIKNKTIGYKKEAGNLQFVIINDAGHIVPLDKPVEIYQIVQDFIQI